MFYSVAKKGKFTADKWRFDKTDSHYCSVVDLLQIKTNFIAKSQLLYIGCPLTRERKQKKNPIFIFKSGRVRLRESVRLR